ncbi:MAG: hypothetical protein OHK0045_21920 [Raineya sp.]
MSWEDTAKWFLILASISGQIIAIFVAYGKFVAKEVKDEQRMAAIEERIEKLEAGKELAKKDTKDLHDSIKKLSDIVAELKEIVAPFQELRDEMFKDTLSKFRRQ